MHGTYDPPGKKVRTDFVHGNGSNVVRATHAGNTSNNTGGTGGESMPQQPIPGSTNPGQPVSRQRALSKKGGPSTTGMGPGLPNRGTSAAGSVR